jgi:hypothetical protein
MIGRHVALVGNSLGRRQGFLVAAGFILGCGFWLASWYLDYRDGKLAHLAADATAFKLTGAWLRDNVATRLIELSSIIAIILAYLQVTGRQFDQFRARHLLRDHVIICGMSSRSQILARDLAEKDRGVVIIDLAPSESAASGRREDGICVIHGDATLPETLLAAGITKASRVVCLTGRDDTNCGVVEACRQLLANGQHGFKSELNVHCHIQNLRLRSQLAKLQIFVRGLVDLDGKYSVRFRLFCTESAAAAEVLQRYPPERSLPRTRQYDDVHVVLVGDGPMAQAMLLEIARVCHYWRSPKEFDLPAKGVRVTWVAPGGEGEWAQLLALSPALADLIDLEIVARSLDDPLALVALDVAFAARAPTQVYAALPDASTTLSHSLLLLDRFKSALVGEGVVAAIFPPQLSPVDIDEWNRDARLQRYDLYAASSADVIIDETNDKIARDIHEKYFASQKGSDFVEGALDDGSSMHPWENLNEWYRESNRSVAAHFDVKLRTFGLRKVPSNAGESHCRGNLTKAKRVLEGLAEMEHRRWLAFHLIGGWQQGELRDNAKRIHPSIKPYGLLSEKEKQKDRDTVLSMAKQLEEVGFSVSERETGEVQRQRKSERDA